MFLFVARHDRFFFRSGSAGNRGGNIFTDTYAFTHTDSLSYPYTNPHTDALSDADPCTSVYRAEGE
jgi:hypothetical protein